MNVTWLLSKAKFGRVINYEPNSVYLDKNFIGH